MGRGVVRGRVVRSQWTVGDGSPASGASPLSVYGWPALFLGVVALMAADLATTAVGLQLGLSEANPVVAAVERRFGVGGIVGLKVAAGALLVALPAATPDPEPVFVVSAASYGAVQFVAVLSNLLHLLVVAG